MDLEERLCLSCRQQRAAMLSHNSRKSSANTNHPPSSEEGDSMSVSPVARSCGNRGRGAALVLVSFFLVLFLVVNSASASPAIRYDESTNAIHSSGKPSSFKKTSYNYDLGFDRLKHHLKHHRKHRRNHKKAHLSRKWEEKRRRTSAKIPEERIFYQTGESDASLPVCSAMGVCAVVDTYGKPWAEKKCRCPTANKSGRTASTCPSDSHHRDGRTVVDKTKQYKLCEPAKRLPRCQRFFQDVSFTRIQYPDNSTQQVMHCRCPRSAVAYLVRREAHQFDGGQVGFQFSFACSPKTKLRCQRKEPCRLFSVREDETTNKNSTLTQHRPPSATRSDLCQCPRHSRCPAHHSENDGVTAGKTYGAQHPTRTYTAFCV